MFGASTLVLPKLHKTLNKKIATSLHQIGGKPLSFIHVVTPKKVAVTSEDFFIFRMPKNKQLTNLFFS